MFGNVLIIPRIVFVILCLMVMVTVSTSLAANKENILESRILKVGDQAPVFTARNIEGGDFRIDEHIGKKPVILFFWSFFCGPCREEMPILQKIYEESGKENIVFVGINLDGTKLAKAIAKYMEDSNLGFTTVFDELDGLEYRIADPYGVAGTPTVYAIDLDGKISYSAVGRVEPEDLKKVLKQTMSGS